MRKFARYKSPVWLASNEVVVATFFSPLFGPKFALKIRNSIQSFELCIREVRGAFPTGCCSMCYLGAATAKTKIRC